VAGGAAAWWLGQLSAIGFLSDDLVQLRDLGRDAGTPVWQWFQREYYGFYRPLTALTWRAQYHVWGMDPAGYRGVNAVLHAAAASGVFGVARGLARPRTGALLAAGLFLVTPGSAAAVLSIAGMTGLLAAVFYLGAVTASLHTERLGRSGLPLALAAASLALLSKETALSLPAAIAAVHGLGRRGSWRLAAARMVPFAGLVGVYLLGRWALFGHLGPTGLAQRSLDPLQWLANLALYGATALVPWGLGSAKPWLRGNVAALVALAVPALALALAWVTWRWRAGDRLPSLATAWALFTAVPVLGLYSPWNAYLPAAGTALLLAGMGLRPGSGQRLRRAGVVMWLVLAIIWQARHIVAWVDAGRLRERLVAAALAEGQRPGPWYLAGAPSEVGDVPVFGGAWGVDAAMRLAAAPNPPLVLPAVHYERVCGRTEAEVDADGTIHLRTLAAADFYRLDLLAVYSRDVLLSPGFSCAMAAGTVVVAAVDAQRQPSVLRVLPANPDAAARVQVWDGAGLVAARQAAD
jgi:hypothetical protein